MQRPKNLPNHIENQHFEQWQHAEKNTVLFLQRRSRGANISNTKHLPTTEKLPRFVTLLALLWGCSLSTLRKRSVYVEATDC